MDTLRALTESLSQLIPSEDKVDTPRAASRLAGVVRITVLYFEALLLSERKREIQWNSSNPDTNGTEESVC